MASIYGWGTVARSSGGAIFLPRAYGYAIQPSTEPARVVASTIRARGTRALFVGHAREAVFVAAGTLKPRTASTVQTRGARVIAFGATPASSIGPRTAELAAVHDEPDYGSSSSVLLGVLGADVPAVGQDGPAILYEEVIANALQANYVRMEVLSVTPSYVATVYGDSSFTVTAPALVGVCEITYRWYIDGVLQSGTGTVTIDFQAFADLAQTDANDTLSAAATRSWLSSVSAALTVTDSADTLSALLNTPTIARTATLSASDEADVLTVAVAVVLPNRQLMVLANDLADTVSAVVLANTESEAALSVTDVADTLAANANMLSVRAITLAYTEPSDTTAALMGTIRSAFESITLQSTINRTVTLPSYMYGT